MNTSISVFPFPKPLKVSKIFSPSPYSLILPVSNKPDRALYLGKTHAKWTGNTLVSWPRLKIMTLTAHH